MIINLNAQETYWLAIEMLKDLKNLAQQNVADDDRYDRSYITWDVMYHVDPQLRKQLKLALDYLDEVEPVLRNYSSLKRGDYIFRGFSYKMACEIIGKIIEYKFNDSSDQYQSEHMKDRYNAFQCLDYHQYILRKTAFIKIKEIIQQRVNKI